MRALQRKFCLLLAIWVLNLSIDAPDLVRALEADGEAVASVAQDPNEVESVGEWVVEHLLGQAEAVPELDEASDAPDDHRASDSTLTSARLKLVVLAPTCVHGRPRLASPSAFSLGFEPPPPRLG